MSVMLSCSTAVKEHTTNPSGMMETGKKNIGNLLALYPKPMTVIGAQVEGKVNWLVVRSHRHYRSRPYTREYE